MSRYAIDLDHEAIRDALISTARVASVSQGGRVMLSERRAVLVIDAALALLRDIGEDLEPTIAAMERETAAAELEASRSDARRARMEHSLGLADVVQGEVLPLAAALAEGRGERG